MKDEQKRVAKTTQRRKGSLSDSHLFHNNVVALLVGKTPSKTEKTPYGTKTYGGNSTGYDMIDYKLYDSDNCVIETGNLYLSSLSNGDKFKDESITIYDVMPGETYKIMFSEYSW